MYYELYIDMFFLVNFIMDILVLSVAKKILKCPASYGNICLGAMTGAALTCLAIFIPLSAGVGKFMIFYGLISILMTGTGLRIRIHQGFLQACIVVYISAFMIGGVFSCMTQYMRKSAVFFVFAWISYVLVSGIRKFLVTMDRTQQVECEVLLINKASKVKVKAMIDTGNRLRDDITGKPVSIISKPTADILWKEMPIEGLRYIPYRTIEGKGGILPMLSVEKICLYQEKEIWLSEILVAICEDSICKGKYEMILSPHVR